MSRRPTARSCSIRPLRPRSSAQASGRHRAVFDCVPEGDTVFVAATRLHHALAGNVLTKTDFRVPALATTDLSGRRVIEVEPRGKHILTRIEGDVTLHTHFKMEGEWHIQRPTERPRGPAHQVRVILATDDVVAIGLRMPVVELIPTPKESDVVGHLGPDPLGSDWDQTEALKRLIEQGARPIAEVLLDQRVIAGPGNVYKSEICFLRGLHPMSLVEEVADPDGLINLTARLLQANRTTGRQITTGDTRRGRGQWVYGRAGKPCRRCGTPIAMTGGGVGGGSNDRVTYWCPHCQPAP
jgi:endonuclease VIII